MLLETLEALRDLPRLHEVGSVLIRYGFGELVRRLGIAGALERADRALHWQRPRAEPPTSPERFRLALEELGPTFVKFGQVLATRSDILPPEWIGELEKLHSTVPAMPFGELLPQLEKALGRSPFEVFVDLETEAAGSASVAQVHRARLADGTPVAVKVLRPHARATVEADARILERVAQLAELEFPKARRYRPRQVVAEFRRSLERELDLAREARSMERFAENFAGDETVLIPKVYWEYTGPLLNVQQRIEGIPGTDPAAVDRAGLDRKLLAARGADAVLKMILADGYFHADPHPGNVFYLPGNRIAMVDFGMVGRLTERRRREIAGFLAALVERNEDGMVQALLDWGGDGPVDEARLAADIGELAYDYSQAHLKDIRMDALLGEITGIMRRHGLVLPSDLTLLFKALVSLEGLGRQLDPEFRMLDRLEPFVRKVMQERSAPAAVLRRMRRNLAETVALLGELPRDAARLIREARRGRMRIDLDLKRLDQFGQQLDHSVNRLTLGIIIAALIIGSSIVMTVSGGPTLFGLPVFGLIGFVVAFFGSLGLMFSIWRSGKGSGAEGSSGGF